MKKDDLYLIGDFGGTHARLAYASGGQPIHEQVFYYPEPFSPYPAVREYLAAHPTEQPVRKGIFAFAGPVSRHEVNMTNRSFNEKISTIQEELGFEYLRIVNDFSAQVMAVPYLKPDELDWIGPLRADPTDSPVAVVGPGTGLGVGYAIGPQVMPSEGGGISFAPSNQQEIDLWKFIRERVDIQIATEDVLSGRGVLRIYHFLSGKELSAIRELTTLVEAKDPKALETYALFFRILAAFAGDIASTFQAEAIYLGGGIIQRPEVRTLLDKESFRACFEDKGPRSYLNQKIPVGIILRPNAALLGLAGTALRRELEMDI